MEFVTVILQIFKTLFTGLGVSHESTKSLEFLLAMREYMPRQHREFLEYLETIACVRQFIVDSLMSHGITSDMRSDSKPVGPVQPAHRSHLGISVLNCTKNTAPLSESELKTAAEHKVRHLTNKIDCNSLITSFFVS